MSLGRNKTLPWAGAGLDHCCFCSKFFFFFFLLRGSPYGPDTAAAPGSCLRVRLRCISRDSLKLSVGAGWRVRAPVESSRAPPDPWWALARVTASCQAGYMVTRGWPSNAFARGWGAHTAVLSWASFGPRQRYVISLGPPCIVTSECHVGVGVICAQAAA